MAYDWKIEYDGADITDKVARFDITADLDQYAREVVVELIDPAWYAALDFSVIPDKPLLEVFTMVDAAWVSQGKFFVERPALSSDINQDVSNGIWGRSETAVLGAPFSPRVSKMWTADTTFFAIVSEMCALAGLSWIDTQSAVDDFYIFAYTYQAENAFPIDVIAELCQMAGAVATCDRKGQLIITAIDYAPTAADVTIDDDQWSTISEEPSWPDFGNRVRIIPNSSLAGYSISLSLPNPCLPADGASRAKVYARITDADGNAVAGQVVAWGLPLGAAAGLVYAATNTGTVLMPAEEIRANNLYQLTLSVPAAAILGVYAYADRSRRTNLAEAGATIDGNQVTLAEPLAYCDQLVRVIYTADGVAVNFVQAGMTAEDIEVTAELAGESAKAELYIGNGCRCPATLKLEAVPTAIEVGFTGQLIVYAEEAGGPITDGRLVRVYDRTATPLGDLRWATARLGQVAVKNEHTEAANDVAGLSQCSIDRFPTGTPQVYRADAQGNPTGANLYAAHAGKVVDLTTVLATGTPLVVHYVAQGAALNYFTSNGTAGTAYFRASMKTNREAPLEADASLRITDPTDPTSGDTPDDYTGGNYGGIGGADDGLDDSWQAGGCDLPDGQVVQCAEGEDYYDSETCCEKDGVVGCWPRTDCDSYTPEYNCTPANVSDNPEASSERFNDTLAAGCSCEEACAAEFGIFGTIQTHDGGSYRTVAEIVEQDQGLSPGGEDDSAYWAAVASEKQAAIDECVAECEAVDMRCHPDNPETFGGANDFLEMRIVGGLPPFTWTAEGAQSIPEEDRPTMAEAETESRKNYLNTGEQECGQIRVTVTDAAARSITCVVHNPNAGTWLPDSTDWHWFRADYIRDDTCSSLYGGGGMVLENDAFRARTYCLGRSNENPAKPCSADLTQYELNDQVYGSGATGKCGGPTMLFVEVARLGVKIYDCPEEKERYLSMQVPET